MLGVWSGRGVGLALLWAIVGWAGLEVKCAIAQPIIESPTALDGADRTQQTPQTQQTLLGRWRGRQAGTKNTDLTLVFQSGGKLFMIADRQGEYNAILAGYEADFSQQPYTLDVALGPGQAVLRGVIDLRDDRLRWQTTTTQQRPTQLDQTASVFMRMQPQISVPTLEPELEGGAVIAQLVIEQLIDALETGRFAQKITDLNGPTETLNYRYDLQISPYSADQMQIVARPKRSDLKSFTAGIVRSPESPNRIMIAAICQSFQASRIAPAMLTVHKQKFQLQCPPGSVKI